jgi:hypothetical protein
MRPAKAAPGVSFVNSPLRQSPNACASDYRGISDPVVPYKPPCLSDVPIDILKFGLGAVNVTLIAAPRFRRCVTCGLHRQLVSHALERRQAAALGPDAAENVPAAGGVP